MGRIEERTNKEQGSRRRKMAIDVAFEVLKIVVIRGARNWKRVPQTGSVRKGAFGEVVVASG